MWENPVLLGDHLHLGWVQAPVSLPHVFFVALHVHNLVKLKLKEVTDYHKINHKFFFNFHSTQNDRYFLCEYYLLTMHIKQMIIVTQNFLT